MKRRMNKLYMVVRLRSETIDDAVSGITDIWDGLLQLQFAYLFGDIG